MKKRKLALLSILSRVLVLSLGVLFGTLVQDYDSSSRIGRKTSLNGLDSLLQNTLIHFYKWDSVYFVGIGEEGYSHEQFFAFFPAFPFVIHSLAHLLSLLSGGLISTFTLVLFCGVFVSNVSFVISSILLYQ